MTTLIVRGPASVAGSIAVPGDKSISHRALMLGAAAAGETTLRGLAPGEDVASTISCLRAYGVRIDRKGDVATIASGGIAAWEQPPGVLDCGNSGTTMRILAGFAARRELRSTFDGDASLRRRPMDRVARPLETLGARVTTTGGHPPITVEGGRLHGTQVDTGVASAQVKSAVLFAALGADGPTTVTEPLPTRDHTERMLSGLGARIAVNTDLRIEVEPFDVPSFHLEIAGDVSSAAFLVAAAVASGEVSVTGVGLNPLRIGFLEALREMGATVAWDADEERLQEPVGTITAQRSDLRAVSIDPAIVPTLHDELPLIAALATQAAGETVVRGAEELRVKEADRIEAITAGLRRLGADIEELSDGFVVRGPTVLSGATVDGAGDHRIAMSLAIAGLVAKGDTRIEGFECADISWPGFHEVLARIGADVELQ